MGVGALLLIGAGMIRRRALRQFAGLRATGWCVHRISWAVIEVSQIAALRRN